VLKKKCLPFSAGYTYTLRVTTELVPVPVTLGVETVGATGYSVSVNGTVIDLSATQIMSGSEVTVNFTVDGAFDPTVASLTQNGEAVTLSGQSYTFVISADTKLVFTYGNLVPITVTLNGPGKVEFQKTIDSTPVQTVVNESNGTVTKTFYATKDEGLKMISTPSLGYELGTVEISEPFEIIAPSGTVSEIYVDVNDKVSSGKALLNQPVAEEQIVVAALADGGIHLMLAAGHGENMPYALFDGVPEGIVRGRVAGVERHDHVNLRVSQRIPRHVTHHEFKAVVAVLLRDGVAVFNNVLLEVVADDLRLRPALDGEIII